MPAALSRRQVALLRKMANNWYGSGQFAVNQQLRRLGIGGSAQAGNIDWTGVTRGFIASERAQERAERKKDLESYYNTYYSRLQGPSRRTNYGSSSAIEQLYREVQNQKRTARNVGAPSSTRSPSVLERIFDVLQRPNYAVAEAVRREYQAKERGENVFQTIDDSIKGLIAGITGKEKTTFGNVLEEGGLTGTPIRGKDLPSRVLRGAGGFALDVVADPTTYIGLGIVKRIGKEAVEKAGKESIEKALRTPAMHKTATNAIAQASKAIKGPVTRADQIRIANDAVADQIKLISKKAQEEAAELGKGRIALKVAGQEIGTDSGIARTIAEGAYSGISRVGARIGRSTTGETLNRAFRTRSFMPGKLHMFHRVFSGRSISELETAIKGWRSVTKGLSRKDAEAVSRAIKSGSDLTGMLDSSGKIDLGEIQRVAKDTLDEFGKLEVLMGYRKPEDLIQNYLPHYGKGTTRNVAKWHDKISLDFEDAADLKVRPTTDIREIVARRATRFFQRKMQYDLVQSLQAEYGIRAVIPGKTSKMGPTFMTLEKTGLRKIPHITADKQMRVPPAVAEFVDEMKRLVDDPEYAKDLLRMYDSILGNWKALVTVVNPGFHVRNTMGDIFLNWLPEGGVKSPIPYKQAAKVMGGGRVGKTVKIGNANVDVEDIMSLYHESGLNVGFFRAEFGQQLVPGMEAVRKASEMRENWVRMAHFIDRVSKLAKKKKIKFTAKDAKKKLAELAMEAGEEVRKFNIDYGDLTPFERNVGKRLIPFYTWTRKFTPLLLEAIALQPGKIAGLPKIQRGIEKLLGTDERDQKVEDMIPEWLKDFSALRIRGGDEPDFVAGGSTLPHQMLGEFSSPGDIPNFLLGLSTPPIQMLSELATGESAFTGAPIEETPADYLANLTSITRLLAKASRGELKGQDVGNWLTGVGYQHVSERSKTGELYRQRDQLRKVLSKRKRELERELKK